MASEGRCVRIVVPGAPRGKGVARVTRFGTHIPEKSRDEMTVIGIIAKNTMAGAEPICGPVVFTLAAYMPITEGWPKQKRADALAGRLPHLKKPDLSNIVKLVEDALLGIVIVDDSQIVESHCWKRYSDKPRYVVEIKQAVDLKV